MYYRQKLLLSTAMLIGRLVWVMPSVLWRCWLRGRKGIRPVKTWVVGCWRGYLSGARCRLAYGPADATDTHCLLLQWNPDWFYLCGTGPPGWSWTKGRYGCVCELIIKKYQNAVDQFWLTDWRHQWLTDCWSCTAFCHDSFSLLRGRSSYRVATSQGWQVLRFPFT